MPSNILVTGGNGFVGSALCARLVDLGHSVVAIDNHSNPSEAPEHPKVQYFSLDCNKIDLLDTFKEKFDYIFHLGEYARVEQSFSDYDVDHPSLFWNRVPPEERSHPQAPAKTGHFQKLIFLKVQSRNFFLAPA